MPGTYRAEAQQAKSPQRARAPTRDTVTTGTRPRRTAAPRLALCRLARPPMTLSRPYLLDGTMPRAGYFPHLAPLFVTELSPLSSARSSTLRR
jgi:hypothetical protein